MYVYDKFTHVFALDKMLSEIKLRNFHYNDLSVNLKRCIKLVSFPKLFLLFYKKY